MNVILQRTVNDYSEKDMLINNYCTCLRVKVNVFQHHFQQYFNYIVAVFLIGGVNQSTRKKHRLAASHWQTLSYNVVSSTHLLNGVRTHNASGDRHWLQGLWKGCSVGTSVRESLKHPISLAIYVLIWFGRGYFQLKSSILREISACPRGPRAVLSRLAKFLLEALTDYTGSCKSNIRSWKLRSPNVFYMCQDVTFTKTRGTHLCFVLDKKWTLLDNKIMTNRSLCRTLINNYILKLLK
jgi:hypothetical protein